MNKLVGREVAQLLRLLQWNVREPDDDGTIVAETRYGA
jgi:hypothetical protein